MIDNSKQLKKLDLKQNAIKLLINSIYGAFGNKWFYFFNRDIAQSITLQGQDLIKFSIKAANHYFYNKWHLDTELHKKLGIDHLKINKIDHDAAIYTDTDSVYVQFDSAILSIEGIDHTDIEKGLELCIAIDRYRISHYFTDCFNKYSKLFNTENRLNLELENLSESGIWLGKKNYAIKVAYEPNADFAVLPKEKRYMIIKGLEPAKSSYPTWAREHLRTLTEYLVQVGKHLDIERDLLPKLKELEEEFKTVSHHDAAFNFKIRVYNKYIESEKDLRLLKGIPIYSRAAAYYNHTLLKTGLNKKYQMLREGDKIKYYHCAPNQQEFEIFAYHPSKFPAEVVPDLDRTRQFFGLIVEPVNRILTAMRMSSLDEELKRAVPYVNTKTKKVLTDDDLFPLYVIDIESLDYVEAPEKFWKIIGNPNADIPEEHYAEYLSVITKYGLNSAVVTKIELPKYLKRLERKAEREAKKIDDAKLAAIAAKNG